MDRLVHGLFHLLRWHLIIIDAQRAKHNGRQEVDLVADDPVLDSALEVFDQQQCIFDEEVDDFLIGKTAILSDQVKGDVVVAHRNDRFHAVFDDLIDHVVVELQAGLIWRFFIASWKDP